jgi:WD40 repeat protein
MQPIRKILFQFWQSGLLLALFTPWLADADEGAREKKEPVPRLVLQRGHAGGNSVIRFAARTRLALTHLRDSRIDPTAILWDLETGKELRRFGGPEVPIEWAVFSPDERMILTQGYEGLTLWDTSTGEVTHQLNVKERIESTAFASDRIALLRAGDKMILWDLVSNKEARRVALDSVAVIAAACSPDGRTLLTVDDRGGAVLRDVASGEPIRRLRVGSPFAQGSRAADGQSACTSPVGFAADGRAVLAFDGEVILWDVRTGERIERLRVAESGRRHKLINGAFLNSGEVMLKDTPGGGELRPLRLDGPVKLMAGVPDGRTLLCGMDDGAAVLWDPSNGAELRRLPGVGDLITMAFTPDGSMLLTGRHASEHSDEWEVTIWDVVSGAQLHRQPLRGTTMAAHDVAVRPEGHVLAVGADRGEAVLWDLAVGRADRRLRTGGLYVKSARFSPDGRTLLTRSPPDPLERIRDLRRDRGKPAETEPGGTILWDAATGLKIGRLDPFFDEHSQYPPVFLSDNRVLVVGWISRDVWIKVRETGRDHREEFLDPTTDNGFVYIKKDDFLKNAIPDGPTGSNIDSYDSIISVALAPDGRRFLAGSLFGQAILWDLDLEAHTAKEARRFMMHQGSPMRFVPQDRVFWNSHVVRSVAISPDGHTLVTGGRDATVWDAESGKRVDRLRVNPRIDPEEFSTNDEPFFGVSSVAFSPDGRMILAGGLYGEAVLWDLKGRREIKRLRMDAGVTSVGFSSEPRLLVTGGKDGTTRLWTTDGQELCSMLCFDGGGWAVVSPDGRFDTDNLEIINGIHWVFPDDPFRALVPEIFMREYYVPRLLSRVLDPGARKRMPRVRPLASVNRAQPNVRVAQVVPGDSSDVANVTVEAVEGSFSHGNVPVAMRSGVYDLRLFRDGQLVGRWPEPAPGDDAMPEPDTTNPNDMALWRDANRVPLVDGKATKTFKVRLPRESAPKGKLSAYAFNEDRVKSATASVAYEVPKGLSEANPKAYLVSFGAAGFSDAVWDLSFSAGDARLAEQELGKALKDVGRYEVVPIVLATDRGTAGQPARPGEAAATAANLKAVLERLAGRPVDPAVLASIPGADKVTTATPDDLVIVFASSHGYTDRKGAYYMFPSDIGPVRAGGRSIDEERDKALLDACISSGELSAWLRPVDAGQLALIVDCCHAAATVEQPGFKPGPMGSRGLGQLAYDKAMRVLAASAADDVALEALVQGEGHGLLTHALVREGLSAGKATAADGSLTLGGLLKYAEARVPTLYAEVLRAAGGGKGAAAGGARVLVAARGAELEPTGEAGPPPESSLLKRNAFQTPALFDYSRGRDAKLDRAR